MQNKQVASSANTVRTHRMGAGLALGMHRDAIDP